MAACHYSLHVIKTWSCFRCKFPNYFIKKKHIHYSPFFPQKWVFMAVINTYTDAKKDIHVGPSFVEWIKRNNKKKIWIRIASLGIQSLCNNNSLSLWNAVGRLGQVIVLCSFSRMFPVDMFKICTIYPLFFCHHQAMYYTWIFCYIVIFWNLTFSSQTVVI